MSIPVVFRKSVFLGSVILVLLTAHLVTTNAVLEGHDNLLTTLNWWFNFDKEYNIPAFYSGLILSLTAYVAYKRSKSKPKNQQTVWKLFAIFFGLLAFDEIWSIHEDFATPMRELFSIERDSIWWQAWVIPAGIVVLAAFLYLWRHVKSKGVKLSRTHKQIIGATAVYLGGVLVIESLGTKVDSERTYRMVTIPIEETYELIMASSILWLSQRDLKLKTNKRRR